MLRVECWLPIPDVRRPLPCWLLPPGPVSHATAWAAWGSSAVAMAGGVLSAVEDGSLIVFVFLLAILFPKIK